MKRILLLACLLACGDVDAQAIGGGAIGGGGSGAAADPTPVFDFDPGAHGSGPAQLTTDAFAMTTVVDCDAQTTTTSWACATGGTFTESEGDVTTGYAAPFTDADARANRYGGTSAHRAPANTVGEVGSGVDVSAIVVFYAKSSAAIQYVLGKFDSANNEGWAIRVSAAGNVEGRVNATNVGSYALDAFGQWNIVELQCDSGATNGARLYVNGVLAGSAANCPSTLATTTSAKHLQFGCRSNGTSTECVNGRVAWARVQTCTGCMTSTATQDAVAKQHAAQIMGVWPTSAVVSAPVTFARTSPKTCDIMRGDHGQYMARSYTLRVGEGWLCVARRQEASGDGYTIPSGRPVVGYFPEPIADNLLVRSQEFNTTWTKLTAGDTVVANPGTLAPNESDDEADRMTTALDVVGVEHGFRQASPTLSASYAYVFSVYVGFLQDGSTKYVWLRDNTVGATAIAWFDLSTCQVATTGAGLKSFGTGVNGGTRGAARIKDVGQVGGADYHWCRPEIVIQGTAAAHNMDIGFSAADGSTTMTTTNGQLVGMVWGAQLEQQTRVNGAAGIVVSERASSYIPTAAASDDRAHDTLQFDPTNWPSAGGMISTAWLEDDGRVSNSPEDGSTARNQAIVPCAVEKNADNYIYIDATGTVETTKYGITLAVNTAGIAQWGNPDKVPSGRNEGFDGRLHWLRFTVHEDYARAYIDGSDDPGLDLSSSITLPTIDTGGVTIGYSEHLGQKWLAGLVPFCRIYATEWAEPNP